MMNMYDNKKKDPMWSVNYNIILKILKFLQADFGLTWARNHVSQRHKLIH